MTSADVIDIYSTWGGLGIQIWIDGGWGVDALQGRQTRPHKDLDIALEDQHLVRFELFLASRGNHRTKREIERQLREGTATTVRQKRASCIQQILLPAVARLKGTWCAAFPLNGW